MTERGPLHQDALGAVAIGRNEGERLMQCLRALVGRVETLVYVDSGSDDGSVERARRLGAEVVELDTSVPFTAARARNAGLRRMLQLAPNVAYVQFVDGDCEVVAGWLETAVSYLSEHEDVAVVCGRRRERYAHASIYNRLCDIEWETPIGDVKACHGDAMMRVTVLDGVGGFNERMIAGEEPELCVRIRQRGWRIVRIDAEMTRHDAAMTKFGQWWKRAKRSGHAYGEGAWLHGGSRQRHNVRPVLSVLFWSAALPIATLVLAWPSGGWSLAFFWGYPVLWLRIYWYRRHHDGAADSALYATFTVVGKLAQCVGLWSYFWHQHIRGRKGELIEYKQQGVPAAVVSGANESGSPERRRAEDVGAQHRT